MAIGDHWNSLPPDLEGPWACDAFAPPGAAELYRAVDVRAPAAVVWSWVCQLRVAPYSYDWIDNLGRRSPPELTPGLDDIELGQVVMAMFRVVDFSPCEQLTLEVGGFLGLGPLHVTYRLQERGAETRLAAKLTVGRRGGWVQSLLIRALAVGDWIMMRKQLLTLKRYAERDACAMMVP